MPEQLRTLRLGDSDLLIEVTPVAGTEPTSRLDQAGERVSEAFDRVREAIVEVAGATVGAVQAAASQTAHPRQVQVEFGLKFSVRGNVIVAGAAGDASLIVRLTYDGPGRADRWPGRTGGCRAIWAGC